MSFPRSVVLSALSAIALLGALPARAQTFNGAYAVQVAPGTYVVRHSDAGRVYPYVSCGRNCSASSGGRHAVRAHARHHRASIEAPHRRQVKNRHAKSRHIIHTTKIVREAPVVIEHRRVVDDPPRIIERRHYVEDAPAPRKRVAVEHVRKKREKKSAEHESEGKPRVIRADAEVTIVGPDRMTIRLLRKRDAEAKARD
jgi:hypothetical protein